MLTSQAFPADMEVEDGKHMRITKAIRDIEHVLSHTRTKAFVKERTPKNVLRELSKKQKNTLQGQIKKWEREYDLAFRKRLELIMGHLIETAYPDLDWDTAVEQYRERYKDKDDRDAVFKEWIKKFTFTKMNWLIGPPARLIQFGWIFLKKLDDDHPDRKLQRQWASFFKKDVVMCLHALWKTKYRVDYKLEDEGTANSALYRKYKAKAQRGKMDLFPMYEVRETRVLVPPMEDADGEMRHGDRE